MKASLLLLVVFGLGTSCVLGFLGKPSYKNACDPDPCKHDSVCKLDTRNQNLSTCVCKGEYTGDRCELKTGCFKNPCKNDGNCTNEPSDKTKHVCKCKEGWVGNCDTSKLKEISPFIIITNKVLYYFLKRGSLLTKSM